MMRDRPNDILVITSKARDLAIEATPFDRLKHDPSPNGRSLAVFATRDDTKVYLGCKDRFPRGDVLLDPI
jgi:hypothetical protein